MELRLREATEADLGALVAQRDAMWIEMRRVAPGEHDPSSAAYGRWLLTRMRNGQLKAFVMERAGHIVGGGALWLQEVQPRPGHPENRWGYLLSVYTRPEARRQGVAQRVVDACIGWAREKGCTRVCLHASAAGRPMYEDMGFEKTDEMWLDLRPPHLRPKKVATRTV
jgi:GNAT superfamily N-acetyltransferase